MQPSSHQGLLQYRRRLICLLLLILVASVITACDILQRTPNQLSTNLTLSQNVGRVGNPVTITFTAVVPPLPDRRTESFTVIIDIPYGMEWVTPLQITLASGSEDCTITASESSFMTIRGDSICQFSVQAVATRDGGFDIRSSLFVYEVQIEDPDSDVTSTSADLDTYYAVNGLIGSKTFNPVQILLGRSSTMTIAITNDTTVNVTGMAFEDPMPAGMELIAITRNTCGGIASVRPDRLTYSGGRLNAGATCSIQATVRGVGAGTLLNTVSFIRTDQFNFSNQPQASLEVLAPTATPLPPTPPPPPDPPPVDDPPADDPPVDDPPVDDPPVDDPPVDDPPNNE
jgi:uncharacterized repeat protein (TIGR01451 family)